MMIDGGDDFIREERRWTAAEQDRKDRNERERRRMRNEWIGYVTFATTVIIVALAIAFVIWRNTIDSRQQDTSRINACSAAGGTWTTIGGGTEKMCVHLSVEAPR